MSSLIDRLYSALPAAAATALEAAAQQAEAVGLPLFLVGGAVRDLLLGRANFDLDLVAEGDVEALVAHLSTTFAARTTRHDRFGTATVRAAGFHLDLARSRREKYERPGALPVVAPAAIEDDLARRDFTVNALALRLTPPAGELLDPFHGQADLTACRIRVLHEQSFRDDATRILRALRYSGRLGFAVDPATDTLITRDLAFIETISGARLRRELSLALAEDSVVDIFEAAADRKVLLAIHPRLDLPPATGAAWRTALVGPRHGDPALLGWCLISACRNLEDVDSLSGRLSLTARVHRVLADLVRLKGLSDKLTAPATGVADAAEVLDSLALEAVWAAAVKGGPPAGVSSRYLQQVPASRPALNGTDLITAGVAPGPEIGRILRLLRRARLEGQIHDRAEEIALVERETGRR
jgi:tRNA nucleotidyltransferase (CCA-adding enzyme)